MTIRRKVRLGLSAAAVLVIGLLAVDQAVLREQRRETDLIDQSRSLLAAVDDARLYTARAMGTIDLAAAGDSRETAELHGFLRNLRSMLRSPALFSPNPQTRDQIVGFIHLAAACVSPSYPDSSIRHQAHRSGEQTLSALRMQRDDILRDTEEARRLEQDGGARRIIIHITVSLGLIFIAWILGRRFTSGVVGPLDELRRRMQRVEAGVYEETPAEGRDDEIGAIAESFDRLSESLSVRKRELEMRTRRIDSIASIASAANWPSDSQAFLQDAIKQTVEALESDLGFARLVDAGTRRLKLVASFGFKDGDALLKDTEYGQYISGLTVQHGEPIAVDDVSGDPRMAPMNTVRREHLVSMAAAPIVSRGRSIGCIILGARRLRRYSQEDISLLETVGRILGAAVETARLARETANRSHELAMALDRTRSDAA